MSPVTSRSPRILHMCARFTTTLMPALLLLAVSLGASSVASAQQDVGYILGTITDQAGAAVVGAKVSVTQQGTGITQNLVSGDLGYYTSQPLQVGQYTISVAQPGFTPATIRDLIVDAAAHVEANLTLHVGTASEMITVESTPPVMDATDAQISNTVDDRDAQQLPINGRSVLALAMLVPGVESSVDEVSEGFQNRGTAVSAIRIAGGVSGANSNILDGVTNLQDWLGEVAINLKSDAVQEFNIMYGIMPAQFGYTSGGAINVVTRSGTNNIHGSVYEFFRNDALDASQAWPKLPFGKQELRYNNYGGTLSGPVLHNKLFVFGNYEQYNSVSALPAYSSLPTLQERTGNFSDVGQVVNSVCKPMNIYDAGTIVGGQRLQFDFNGISNNINPARLDPVAVAYQNMFYPAPNNTAGSYNSCTHSNNYLYAFPIRSNERQGVIRADYRLFANDSVVARYAYYLNANNDGTGVSGLPGGVYSNRYDTLQTHNAVLSEIHAFKPTLLNDARFGGILSDFPFQAGSSNKNIAGKIGLPNDTSLLIPYMSNGMIAPMTSVGFRSSTSLEGIDDLTWILKEHTLHIGGSVRFTEGYNNQTGSDTSGTFNFSAVTTGEGNDNSETSTSTGSSYASFLLGQVRSASQVVQQGAAFRRMMYAVYVQDDWRATPRLTINAGLRWDFMSQATEKHNGLENFDITKTDTSDGYLGAVEYANTNGYGRNFVKENYGNYGPRLGFAYALTKDTKTVVRGGAAIYYPAVDTAAYDQSSGSTAGYSNFTTSWSAPTTYGFDFQLQNGFPSAWRLPLGVAGGQSAFLGQSASYILPTAKDPSSEVFTLGASRELPWNVVANVSYVGNHGNHFLNAQPNINTLAPQYYSRGTAALTASVPNPYAGLVPGSLGAAKITESQLLSPFPYMSSVTIQEPRNASYWSNLALVSVQHRVQHGLQVIGSYTFGKITDNGLQDLPTLSSVGTSSTATPQNWRDPKASHGIDPIDVTHRLTMTGLYNLPFGKGQRFLSNPHTNSLLGGWQYNVIMVIASGRPVGITGASNHLATQPNWNPGVPVNVPHPSRSALYKTGYLEWFNPNAFVNPPDYTFGNVKRYLSNVRGPGKENFDMSLFKTTHINEHTTVELRIEAYDAFNHVNLSMPAGTFYAGAPANLADPYAEGGLNNSSSFGNITSTGAFRNIELAAKIFF